MGATPPGTARAGTNSLSRSVAHKLIALINADRAAHHAAPLVLDRLQSRCSLKHARHMASRNVLSHDQFPSDICTPHTWAGENVGVAPGDPVAGAEALERSMMAEGPCPDRGCPDGEFEQHGHYLNLISRKYTRIGIGVYIADGSVWIAEDFTDGKPRR